jgi:molecular chaperone IbpA
MAPKSRVVRDDKKFLHDLLKSCLANLKFLSRDAEHGSRLESLGENSGDFEMATTLSLAPLFRQSVGFDRFNDLFESALRSETGNAYPPHNVEKHGDDEYRIVIAAAGLAEQDIDIQVEKGVLTVAGGKRETEKEVTYLHQGIAQRAFRLSFRLADHIEVHGASLNNGLLSIELLRTVPEEAKPRRIAIGGSDKPDLKAVGAQ